MLSKDQFEQEAGRIPYQYKHPFMLYALIKWLKPQTVVEVGTHIGMSAVWMARGLQENGDGKLYCIDPFCWVNEDQENLWNKHVDACGVRGQVELIKGRSQEVVWPKKINIAFVDANHTYDCAKHDVDKARDFGATIIAMHDSVSWEGSRRYAEEIKASWKDWDFLEENSEGGLLIAKKQEPKVECWGLDIGEQWDTPTKEKP